MGKSTVTKSSWSAEEDSILIELVRQHGPKKWSLIANSLAPRIGKQCRERWHNHLNPEVRKDAWSPEEDRLIYKLVQEIGTKWASIAKKLDGRTDNAIKNRYYSSLKKHHDVQKSKNKRRASSQPEESSDDASLTATPPRSRKRRRSSIQSHTSEKSVTTDYSLPRISLSTFPHDQPMSFEHHHHGATSIADTLSDPGMEDDVLGDNDLGLESLACTRIGASPKAPLSRAPTDNMCLPLPMGYLDWNANADLLPESVLRAGFPGAMPDAVSTTSSAEWTVKDLPVKPRKVARTARGGRVPAANQRPLKSLGSEEMREQIRCELAKRFKPTDMIVVTTPMDDTKMATTDATVAMDETADVVPGQEFVQDYLEPLSFEFEYHAWLQSA